MCGWVWAVHLQYPGLVGALEGVQARAQGTGGAVNEPDRIGTCWKPFMAGHPRPSTLTFVNRPCRFRVRFYLVHEGTPVAGVCGHHKRTLERRSIPWNRVVNGYSIESAHGAGV